MQGAESGTDLPEILYRTIGDLLQKLATSSEGQLVSAYVFIYSHTHRIGD